MFLWQSESEPKATLRIPVNNSGAGMLQSGQRAMKTGTGCYDRLFEGGFPCRTQKLQGKVQVRTVLVIVIEQQQA